MSKIYVVFGEQGEYSDWSTWPVKAFISEAAANEFETACMKFADARTKRITAARNVMPSDPWYYKEGCGMTKQEMADRYSKWEKEIMEPARSASGSPDRNVSEYGGSDMTYSVKEIELE